MTWIVLPLASASKILVGKKPKIISEVETGWSVNFSTNSGFSFRSIPTPGLNHQPNTRPTKAAIKVVPINQAAVLTPNRPNRLIGNLPMAAITVQKTRGMTAI